MYFAYIRIPAQGFKAMCLASKNAFSFYSLLLVSELLVLVGSRCFWTKNPNISWSFFYQPRRRQTLQTFQIRILNFCQFQRLKVTQTGLRIRFLFLKKKLGPSAIPSQDQFFENAYTEKYFELMIFSGSIHCIKEFIREIFALVRKRYLTNFLLESQSFQKRSPTSIFWALWVASTWVVRRLLSLWVDYQKPNFEKLYLSNLRNFSNCHKDKFTESLVVTAIHSTQFIPFFKNKTSNFHNILENGFLIRYTI